MVTGELKRYWSLFSIFVLLLTAGWIWFSADQTTGQNLSAPAVSFMAPDFTLSNAAGNTFTLSNMRDHVVLVNFWASWCPPCKAEMPAMQRVYEAYKEQGFTILAVNVTTQDQMASAESFIKSLNITFPILYDIDGKVAEQYQNQALPTSYFVDTNGIIQEVIVGGPMAEALLRIRIEKLLVAHTEVKY
jgi:cytochrome c biogenesis protein CcmG/thiol:disulfide interchange protein DsbE